MTNKECCNICWRLKVVNLGKVFCNNSKCSCHSLRDIPKNNLKEKFIKDFWSTKDDNLTPLEFSANWWLAERSALLTEIAGKVEKLETTLGVSQGNHYEIGQNHGRQEFKRKTLSIINNYKNEDKD